MTRLTEIKSVGLATDTASAVEVVVPFVDLTSATESVRHEVAAGFDGVLARNAFVNGPEVADFEREFAEWCGAAHCVGVASGLDALRLALLAADVGPGDEVVVPALTFIATFEAVTQVGAVPVVVDVQESDYNINSTAVADVLSERTACLLPVHLYGQMADMRALRDLGGRHEVPILEDACQAHGAERDGLRAGSAGEMAAFSFYPSKNLGAMGDAGAFVTDDEHLAARVRMLREHGQTATYRSEVPGYTARLDTVQALVLSCKLRHVAGWNAQRSAAAAVYSAALEGIGDLRLPAVDPGSKHVWHLYVVRTEDPVRLSTYLRDKGIASGRHYPEPPHLSPAYAALGFTEGAFPVAEAVAREGLSLPLFPGISEVQLAHVCEAIKMYFAHG